MIQFIKKYYIKGDKMNYKFQQAMKAYNSYHNMKSEDALRTILLLIGSKEKGYE